jgi:hypothetical protein
VGISAVWGCGGVWVFVGGDAENPALRIRNEGCLEWSLRGKDM